MAFEKQKLDRTFNFAMQGVIDLTKFSNQTMWPQKQVKIKCRKFRPEIKILHSVFDFQMQFLTTWPHLICTKIQRHILTYLRHIFIGNLLLVYLINRIHCLHNSVFEELKVTEPDRIVHAVVFHKLVVRGGNKLSCSSNGMSVHVRNTTISGHGVVGCRPD